MPLTLLYLTVTGRSDRFDSVTVKTADLEASLTSTSLMVTSGRSSSGVMPSGTVPLPSSMMVPSPSGSLMTALLLGFPRLTVKVSPPS